MNRLTKRCPRCGEVKAVAEFYRNRAAHDGLSVMCKLCEKKRSNKYNYAHRDESRIRAKAADERRREEDPQRAHTFYVWRNLRDRCLNPKHPAFKHYGGRGITVCERWNSFENFLADMGLKPDQLSIDRINVNGNYEPSNCRWADAHTQAINKRPRAKKAVAK